jgi:phospholipid transport system transporter-binding protein
MPARRSTRKTRAPVRQGRRGDQPPVSAAPASVGASTATAPAVAKTLVIDGRGQLVLAPSCTLREAVAMKAQLLEQLDLMCDVEIDGRAVDKIDTAGLQLLVAFSRQLREGGRDLAWAAAAPPLRRAALQLGLADTLGLPAAEAAP